MSIRKTGISIVAARRPGPSWHGGVQIDLHIFAEVEDDQGLTRLGGSRWGPVALDPDGNLGKQLLDEAYAGRMHLEDLYTDLVRADVQLTRWDLWAAPFAVELSDQVRGRVDADRKLDV